MDKYMDKIIQDYLLKNRDNFIQDLKGLIAFDSKKMPAKDNMPFGEECAASIDYMMDICEKSGLKTRNFDHYAMDAEYGEGDEIVASLTHLDIVPAGEGWSYPPFGGVMEGSLMYGRGVSDDKGPSIAALYALKALIETKVSLKRKIRLIFGSDEETGMTDMQYYLSKTKAPEYAFSPDAGFPVCYAEKNGISAIYKTSIKGSTLIDISGGTVTNAVPGVAIARIKTDKCPASNDIVEYENKDGILTIIAYGKAGHAANPQSGINAIMKLVNYILPLLDKEDIAFDKLTSIIKHMSATNGSGMGIDCHDEATQDLTMNLGIIKKEVDVISLLIDIRHPVTLDGKITMDKMISSLPAFELVDSKFRSGLYHPIDGFLVKTLQSVYQGLTNDMRSPTSMGGGTYASKLPNAVAFGPGMPDTRAGGAHTVDEFCDIDALIKAARIYAHAFYALAK